MDQRKTEYFDFGTKKIVDAAGVIFEAEQCDCLSYLRLLKLLYIADRESIRETGRPIIGTRPVAMERGPLHSKVLDLINGTTRYDNTLWREFICKDNHNIRLIKKPDKLSLSRYEVEKLRETVTKYKNMDDWKLVDITHKFAEWVKNKKEKSNTIPFDDIIEAVNRSGIKQDILDDAKRVNSLNRRYGVVR
jgi:uncharacterized phage-associated protein